MMVVVCWKQCYTVSDRKGLLYKTGSKKYNVTYRFLYVDIPILVA